MPKILGNIFFTVGSKYLNLEERIERHMGHSKLKLFYIEMVEKVHKKYIVACQKSQVIFFSPLDKLLENIQWNMIKQNLDTRPPFIQNSIFFGVPNSFT